MRRVKIQIQEKQLSCDVCLYAINLLVLLEGKKIKITSNSFIV